MIGKLNARSKAWLLIVAALSALPLLAGCTSMGMFAPAAPVAQGVVAPPVAPASSQRPADEKGNSTSLTALPAR